jgi:cellulose synthase/poly-beta-1,6-N-acetylglucosamine synthase-like glycosyltransferase
MTNVAVDGNPRPPGDRTVDVVCPSFNEKPSAVRATLEALSSQTLAPSSVLIVDDASTVPVQATQDTSLRLSAARNRGFSQSSAEFVAFINIEVLLEPAWLETCVGYLLAHPEVGLVTTRVLPAEPVRATTR